MTKINDGGPAYPSRALADPKLVKHLRDSAEVSLREAWDGERHQAAYDRHQFHNAAE